jgi:hypothetical protein
MPVIDPIKFGKLCWPHVELYNKQREILYSLRDNDETIVPAGNDLGKDFIAAYAVLWFFCSRRPVKIVTTSVQGAQLGDVLWAELRRLIDESVVRLPIQYNHMYLRHIRGDGSLDPRSSVTGQVTRQGESLLGRHIEKQADGIPRTLAVFDEASGIADTTYESADTWAHRKLVIGNPYPCTNFFFKAVKAGDLRAPDNGHYYRKIIQIKAQQSPHVQLAEAQAKNNREITGEVLIPGVLDYETYKKRRLLWDRVRQCVGLDAEFYEGAEVLMYPPDWLNRAELVAAKLNKTRKAEAIGVDSAQGGDNTAWAAVDRLGLINLVSKKTPDTSVIPGETIAFMHKHDVRAAKVFFDAGGGGKQHVDRLRRLGHNVQSVAFGGAASTVERYKRHRTRKERGEADEVRAVYKNRRAEMYGILMDLLDPADGQEFGLPAELVSRKRLDGGPSLRSQLAPIPKDYGAEGVLELPPKNKKNANDEKPTLTEIIGCSPDEADALVLATFGLKYKGSGKKIRAF